MVLENLARGHCAPFAAGFGERKFCFRHWVSLSQVGLGANLVWLHQVKIARPGWHPTQPWLRGTQCPKRKFLSPKPTAKGVRCPLAKFSRTTLSPGKKRETECPLAKNKHFACPTTNFPYFLIVFGASKAIKESWLLRRREILVCEEFFQNLVLVLSI
jgi:hypothetical protein